MTSKKKDTSANVCPECGEPPATSGNTPGSTVTVYTDAAGHQWEREEG